VDLVLAHVAPQITSVAAGLPNLHTIRKKPKMLDTFIRGLIGRPPEGFGAERRV
jgi:hypothetical protein